MMIFLSYNFIGRETGNEQIRVAPLIVSVIS